MADVSCTLTSAPLLMSVQVRGELRNMRADGCSFEPTAADRGAGTAASSYDTGTMARGAEAVSGWSRAPGVSGWDDCFRCMYSCGISKEVWAARGRQGGYVQLRYFKRGVGSKGGRLGAQALKHCAGTCGRGREKHFGLGGYRSERG